MYTASLILQFALSLTVIFLVLIHSGRGGGLSDMFGGGISSSAGSSGVAEKNLNNITIGTSVAWGVIVILLGLVQKVM